MRAVARAHRCYRIAFMRRKITDTVNIDYSSNIRRDAGNTCTFAVPALSLISGETLELRTFAVQAIIVNIRRDAGNTQNYIRRDTGNTQNYVR